MAKKIRKIFADIPLAGIPCYVARDRVRLPDDAFLRRYGQTKTEYPHCDIVDHYDPDFHPEVADKDPNYAPTFDASQNKPKAEGYVTNGRTVLTTCVAHNNSANDEMMKLHIMLHGLRKTLLPGESPSMQRLFNGWVRDRKDRVTKKRGKEQAAARQTDYVQNMADDQKKQNAYTQYDGAEPYESEMAATEKPFDVSDLVAQHGGIFNATATEADEPDISTTEYDLNGPEW